jgi:GNAT superfamily N-acetyltransferase
MEYQYKEFTISTERSRLDIGLIYRYLSEKAYWAKGRTFETVEKSIEHSLSFGVYQVDQQVGFARVVTDYATYGWLCDVFILEACQGQGLGKWLVECVVRHPDLSGMKRIMLATRDAHELYRKVGGFEKLANPDRWMERLAAEA